MSEAIRGSRPIDKILIAKGEKNGAVVAILAKAKAKQIPIKELIEGMQSAITPKWLDVDKTALSAKVLTLPAREDIDFEFNEQLIVELYSK